MERNLLIGGHGTKDLVRLELLDGEKVVDEERLLKAVGDRVRDVRQGPDGALSVVTDDNSNGRVLKLVPKRPSQ